MKRYLLPLVSTWALLFYAAVAQSAPEIWRLTVVADHATSGFTPPSFANMGNTFTIDYSIDPSVPLSGSVFGGAVSAFHLGVQPSAASGYILSFPGLAAINAFPLATRSDGIDFLSFNYFTSSTFVDVSSALAGFSTGVMNHAALTELRLDFGNNSLWARPESFAAVSTDVPEPGTLCLVLLGLCALLRCACGGPRVTAE